MSEPRDKEEDLRSRKRPVLQSHSLVSIPSLWGVLVERGYIGRDCRVGNESFPDRDLSWVGRIMVSLTHQNRDGDPKEGLSLTFLLLWSDGRKATTETLWGRTRTGETMEGSTVSTLIPLGGSLLECPETSDSSPGSKGRPGQCNETVRDTLP